MTVGWGFANILRVFNLQEKRDRDINCTIITVKTINQIYII